MKPVIGITSSRLIGGAWGQYSTGHYMDYVFDEYSRSILACGGVPILIPVAQNKDSIRKIVKMLDGILLSGGPDINPRFYGEQPIDGLGEIDEALDLTELDIAKSCFSMNKPIFAICRGIQVLNVALGGSLYQDISKQIEGCINHLQPADKSVNTHWIKTERNSLLHSIMKKRKIWVNGRHHQAIKRVATDLLVCAKAPDGVIEAVEAKSDRFALGVQWHPEGTFTKDKYSKYLFHAFIKAASTSK